MEKFSGLVAAFFFLLGIACPSNATLLTNGDFETGDFEGWTREGDVRIAHTDDLGGSFAEAQGMDGFYALLGLSETVGTSTLSQNFEVSGISHLEISFNWAFDYFDNSRSADDTFLSFVRLDDGSSVYDITLIDLQTNGTGFWSPDGGMSYGTYTNVIDISPYVTGADTIMFSLIEEGDCGWFTGTASFAGIDNVSITPTPEPTTVMLFGIGVLGFGVVSRKKLMS